MLMGDTSISQLVVMVCAIWENKQHCCCFVPGRTGTMVCTWLIDSDQFESAQVCLFTARVYVRTYLSKMRKQIILVRKLSKLVYGYF